MPKGLLLTWWQQGDATATPTSPSQFAVQAVGRCHLAQPVQGGVAHSKHV